MGSRVTTSNVVGVLDKETCSLTYLFILVADTLTRILSLAGKNSSIQKVGSFPWPNDLISLHYIDDTLFLVLGDDRSLICLKILLYAFEMMTSLKLTSINLLFTT